MKSFCKLSGTFWVQKATWMSRNTVTAPVFPKVAVFLRCKKHGARRIISVFLPKLKNYSTKCTQIEQRTLKYRINVWDNHKFQITAVHWHGAESVILVLKQALFVFLMISCKKTWCSLIVFVETLAQHISLGTAINSCVHDSPIEENGTTQFSGYHVRNCHLLFLLISCQPLNQTAQNFNWRHIYRF